MKTDEFKNLRVAGKVLFGAAAVSLGLYFGGICQPGAVVYATDVAVDFGTEETGGETGGESQQQPSESNVEVYLSESYKANFGLYEQGFNNRYFIYSNISNGGITSDPVVLDIPENLSFTMEKDGKPIAYKSGTAVSALGVYVMTIRLDETDGIHTTHYTAIFRFRIMEAAAQVQPDITDPSQGGIYVTPEVDYPQVSDEEIEEIGRRYEDLTPEEQALLEEISAGSEVIDEEFLNEDGTINQEALDRLMAEKMEEMGEIDDIYVKEGINDGTGIASVYDSVSGYYKHTLRSGQVFYAQVTNGGIATSSVGVTVSDGLEFTVYKDGEVYESEEPNFYTEPGSYLLIPTSKDVVYLDAYQEEKPVFSFRIIDYNYATNNLSLIHAPEGYSIGKVYLEEEECHSAAIINESTVMLREDGNYRIEMTDGITALEVAYRLDRIRPKFVVQTQKNQAHIGYLSTDCASTQIYRNDQLYSEGDLVYVVDKTGSYKFFVFDSAGNYSGKAFEIKYGFNKGAIVAIAIVIAAIIGLFAYLRYLNTHVKVR